MSHTSVGCSRGWYYGGYCGSLCRILLPIFLSQSCFHDEGEQCGDDGFLNHFFLMYFDREVTTIYTKKPLVENCRINFSCVWFDFVVFKKRNFAYHLSPFDVINWFTENKWVITDIKICHLLSPFLPIFTIKNEKVGHLVVLTYPFSSTKWVSLQVTRGDKLKLQLSPLK